MFKKFASFALFLAVVGLLAASSVDAQRLISRATVKSEDIVTQSFEPVVAAIEPEANPAANLDQCRNGKATAPVNCGPGWANGNAGAQNAHYAEGLNIHYRMLFSNLTVGTTYVITLGYDAWHQDNTHNALDFLNTYDAGASGYTVVPCDVGPAVCSGGTTTTPMPDDPCHGFDNLVAGRVFTGWGMTVTASQFDSPLNTPALCDVQERRVLVSFTALVANPVLAWSGHIAKASDWNSVGETSASSIQGSPYHMRIPSNTGWGGQQDRSLSTDAVVTVSAAGATVAGRVTDPYGRAISSAKMTVYNASTGDFQSVFTNTFGYYKFEDLPVGDFYVMSVEHRRYFFMNGSVSFTLEDNLDSMNFQASR